VILGFITLYLSYFLDQYITKLFIKFNNQKRTLNAVNAVAAGIVFVGVPDNRFKVQSDVQVGIWQVFEVIYFLHTGLRWD
jgi:hypothetical protein